MIGEMRVELLVELLKEPRNRINGGCPAPGTPIARNVSSSGITDVSMRDPSAANRVRDRVCLRRKSLLRVQ
jgi:hypothetical protein